MGGSAGGLLMGAVVNNHPEYYKGVVAAVPFVDVVTTMLDESIPLTTGEYDEWGNPNQREYYDYMLSYSPYDQVKAQAYPNMLVTTGLHDSQVQYFEPAKWVAKLRDPQNRQPPAAAAHRHGRRPRRGLGPLQKPPRYVAQPVRLHADAAGREVVTRPGSPPAISKPRGLLSGRIGALVVVSGFQAKKLC